MLNYGGKCLSSLINPYKAGREKLWGNSSYVAIKLSDCTMSKNGIYPNRSQSTVI